MAPDFDVSQYLGIFLDEAREQLQELDRGILSLEKEGADDDTLNRIFRAAHTLKGSSASMGFEKTASLTHALEGVLDSLRQKELEPAPELVDLLLAASDKLQELINLIAAGETETEVGNLVQSLKQISTRRTGKPAAAQAIASSLELDDVETRVARAALEKGFKVYRIKVTLAEGCLMKAARAYIVFNNLKDLGEVIKTVPSTEEIEDENFERSFELVFVTTKDKSLLEYTIKSVSEIEQVQIDSLTPGEKVPGETVVTMDASQPAAAREEPAEEKNTAFAREATKKTNPTVRVDIQRLENLMNLVGELVIDKTRLELLTRELKKQAGVVSGSDHLQELSSHIGRITTDLQEEIMKARMFPIDQVFNRFPRMVRDLAQKSGKRINFVVEGRETELDRTVIEEIGDPLIHLLRNAVDHGIESPEERRALGKAEEGTISLKALQRENQIFIIVEDDGRGMDPQVIKTNAVQKGLITAEAAERLSQWEIQNLIFAPGFSTAAQVTDVSGRGVGMDIVKNNLEKINGLIEIFTTPGRGTRFEIRLPLTLAINRAMLVAAGKRTLAVPLSSVIEIVNLERAAVQTVADRPVAVIRDEVIPVVVLDDLLENRTLTPKPGRLDAVVVGLAENKACLVVDGLLGEQEIVIKSLGEYLGQVSGLAGATIMGDGSVALIIDVRGLLRKEVG